MDSNPHASNHSAVKTPPISRRSFLDLAWRGLLGLSGLLGLAGLLRYLSYPVDPAPPSEFDLGLPENYPPGSTTPLPQAHAVLINTPQGFLALSTTCPHLGCQVEASATGFTCPCHGSRFDNRGDLLRGPAEKPLKQLLLETDSLGHLILHTDNAG